MKKCIIAVLAVICMACLGLAVACTKPYYALTFILPDGVKVECEAQNGAEVPQGYEINFTLVISEEAEGEPVVKINGETVNPDGSGTYSFIMESDTTVEVTGVYIPGATGVIFDTQYNDFVAFLSVDGEELTEVDALNGEVVKFKTRISPYYDGVEIKVVANKTTILEPVDGVYSVTVNGKVTVTFSGIPDNVLANSFIGREDGGLGTANNPFIIKTPLDLFAISYAIGDGYTPGDSLTYHEAYYLLANDIDMRGEKLFIIGDGRTDYSMFVGVFDGGGHTISNYYIDDNVINQTTFLDEKIFSVGLFGVVAAMEDRPTGVYNLNLKDFTITVDGGAGDNSVRVGGVIGTGIGATVSNCSVSGEMIVDSNSTYFGYAGGIIGFQQSFYNELTDMRAYSVIQSCSTDMTIMGTSGYVLAAGGISGYTYSYEESTTASILNCYSNSNVSGAMRVGGIAGMLNPFSSVKNCYSTGYIEASSTLTLTPGLDMYSYAYAGGIVGYAEYESILADSYSTAICDAYSVVSGFNFSDGILGGTDGQDSLYLHSQPALVYNCHSTNNTVYGKKVSNVTDDFLKNTLNWDVQDWQFNGDGKPTVEQESLSKTFTVTVSHASGIETYEVTDTYVPMAYWYLLAESTGSEKGIPQYYNNGSLRTYGYYFDAALTQKVPKGYIPTHDLTIYTKFVDYSEVSGVYYLDSGDGSYVTLDEEGYLVYRKGAVSCVSTYYYDGKILVLENTFFAILLHEDIGFYTYVAEVDGGVMTIYEKEDPYAYVEGSQVITVNNYTKDNPLKAVKVLENFRYGSYYSADGTSYTFNADGTGLLERPSEQAIAFTYVIEGNSLTVSYSGTSFECAVENGIIVSYNGAALSEYDAFKGDWEKASSAHMQYSFDGKGNWSYVYYGYDADGNKTEKQTLSGTYTVNDEGVLSFDSLNKTATLKDGLLLIDGVQYSVVNSFAGTWVYNNTQYTIELTLNGITTEGYGTGSISYGAGYSTLDINYEIVETSGGTAVAIYYYYQGYGLLNFDPAAGTLTGSIYVASADDVVSGIRFCMYDDYRGLWKGEGGVFDGVEVRFNGFGNYDIAGSGNVMSVKANVYVNGNIVATYELDEFTLNGTLIYKADGKTYELEYDAENDEIIVTSEEGTSTLTRI